MRGIWGEWRMDTARTRCMCWAAGMVRWRKCRVTAPSSSPTACPLVLLTCKFTDIVTWPRLLHYFAVWCILIICCSVPSVWFLHLSEAAISLNFSLRRPLLKSDLLSRRLLIALLNTRLPAPHLHHLSAQLSLPPITMYRACQPAHLHFHHILNFTLLPSLAPSSTSVAFSSFSSD